MTFGMRYWLGGFAIATAMGAGSAMAADLGAPSPEALEQAAVIDEWSFTVAPYIWLTAMDGKAGLFGLPPQNIDASISDILNNLNFAAMIAGEARYGRWSLGLDLIYSDLGADVDTPRGILAESIDVSATMLIVTAVGGYAVIDDDRTHVDVIAGARLWSTDTDFDFNGGVLDGRSRSDGATWIDPMIGARARADLGDSSFYLSGWAMVGGFGVGSDFEWDVMGGVGYEFTELASVLVGFRALGVDYSDDGYVLDVTMYGPTIGAVFRF